MAKRDLRFDVRQEVCGVRCAVEIATPSFTLSPRLQRGTRRAHKEFATKVGSGRLLMVASYGCAVFAMTL